MISTYHDVFCDHPECGQWCGEGWPTVRTARKLAKKLGWRRKFVGGRWVDLCPEHAGEGAVS